MSHIVTVPLSNIHIHIYIYIYICVYAIFVKSIYIYMYVCLYMYSPTPGPSRILCRDLVHWAPARCMAAGSAMDALLVLPIGSKAVICLLYDFLSS